MKLTLDFETAKGLKYRQILHLNNYRNSKFECQNWRVNGKVKLWAKSPNRIEIPLKHGLNKYYTINENDLSSFHLEINCPLDRTGRITHAEQIMLNIGKDELAKYYKLKTYDTAIPQSIFDKLIRFDNTFNVNSQFVYSYDKPNQTCGILFPLTSDAEVLMKKVLHNYIIPEVKF